MGAVGFGQRIHWQIYRELAISDLSRRYILFDPVPCLGCNDRRPQFLEHGSRKIAEAQRKVDADRVTAAEKVPAHSDA